MTAIRVLIVDDHPVVRAGLRAALSVEPAIVIAGEAATGEAAVDLAAATAARPGPDGPANAPTSTAPTPPAGSGRCPRHRGSSC